jgi:hypothetical protein
MAMLLSNQTASQKDIFPMDTGPKIKYEKEEKGENSYQHETSKELQGITMVAGITCP